VTEHGLHLCGVGTALAESRREGAPAAVGPKPGDVGVVSGGEHNLGDAGVGERAALPAIRYPLRPDWHVADEVEAAAVLSHLSSVLARLPRRELGGPAIGGSLGLGAVLWWLVRRTSLSAG
jgi:hypothetical protein